MGNLTFFKVSNLYVLTAIYFLDVVSLKSFTQYSSTLLILTRSSACRFYLLGIRSVNWSFRLIAWRCSSCASCAASAASRSTAEPI